MRARIQEVRRKWLSRTGEHDLYDRLDEGAWNVATAIPAFSAGVFGDIAQPVQDVGIGLLNMQMDAIDPTGRVRAMSGQHQQLQSPEVPFSSPPIQRLMGGDPTAPESLLASFASPDPTDLGRVGLMAAPIGFKAWRAEQLGLLATEKLASAKPPLKPKQFVSGKGKTANVTAKKDFSQQLEVARAKMSKADRAQVNPLDADFDGQVYLTGDGMAGFALSKDGYVSNLFRNPDAPFSGTMGAALTKARAEGAKNLHAFDTYLARGYVARGAVETGRGPWNPKYATPEIIEALGDQKPAYVSMDIGGVIPEQKHSTLLEPRPQVELERWRGKGPPKSVAQNFTAQREAQFREALERGVAIGGEKWYWLGGLLDSFIAELGPELGVQRFDKFMDFNAATSGRSKVPPQIKRASVLYQRWVQGKPLHLAQPPGSTANPTGAITPHFPAGHGHLAHDTHMGALKSYEEQGDIWSPIMQPKYAGYSENLKGNYDPAAIDTHMGLFMTGGNVPVGSRSPGYAALEDINRNIAGDYGLQAAEGQSSVWVGGADLGMIKVDRDSLPNMTAQMNQRIAKTAEVLDIPEEEAFIRFVHGDAQLQALVGAVGLGLLGEALLNRPAASDQESRDGT